MNNNNEYNLFPKLRTKNDIWTLKMGSKEIKLVYRTRKYRLVETLEELNSFREGGVKLYHFRKRDREGNVQIAYYELESVREKTPEEKGLEINNILDKIYEGTEITLREKIERDWNIHAHKTTKTPLGDMGSNILSSLAEYYAGGEFSESETKRKEKNIQRNEGVSFEVVFDRDNGSVMEDPSKIDKTFEKTTQIERESHHDIVSKKWLKSTTKKMNEIFSHHECSDYPEHFKLVGWGDEIFSVSPDYQHNIERIINPKEKYFAEWCLVNTENEFKFDNKMYHIDEALAQYRAQKMERVSDRYEMETILVIEQHGEKYYFDENIEIVQSEKINIV